MRLDVDNLDAVKRHRADARGHDGQTLRFYPEFSGRAGARPAAQANSVAARFALTSAALNRAHDGGMAERSKAHAWKVCIRHNRIVGSNPTPSATFPNALQDQQLRKSLLHVPLPPV